MPPVRAASKGETQGVTTAGEQPARSPIGAANEGETQGVTTAGEQPARSPVGAANEGETHGKSTEYLQSNHRLIFILFRGLLWDHQKRYSVSKTGEDVEVLDW